GNNAEGTRELRNLLTMNKLYKVVQATDHQEAIRKLAQEKMNLLIFDMEVLTEERLNVARNVKGLGYRAPILMLARAVAPKAREHIRNFPKFVVLEKPFEHKHFFGVTSKLLEGIPVPQQF